MLLLIGCMWLIYGILDLVQEYFGMEIVLIDLDGFAIHSLVEWYIWPIMQD